MRKPENQPDLNSFHDQIMKTSRNSKLSKFLISKLFF